MLVGFMIPSHTRMLRAFGSTWSTVMSGLRRKQATQPRWRW